MKKPTKMCFVFLSLLLTLLLLSACGASKNEDEETKKSTRKATTTAEQNTEATTPKATTIEVSTTTPPEPETPSDALLLEIKNGNYIKAIEIYGSDVVGNSREETAVQTLLDTYLKDNWQAYYDETLPEAEMKIVLTTLERFNDRYYILNNLYDYQYYFDEISTSRANYKEGVKLAEEGKYMEAAAAFEQVDPADSANYVSAQEKAQEARTKYKQEIIAKAQPLVEEKKYSEAFNLILNAEDMLAWTDSELSEYLIEINTLYVADDMQKAYDAEKYVDVVNRYEQALHADWGINPTADMTELYTNSKSAFLNKVEQEALAAFGSKKDYEAALTVIRSAIAEASSNEGLLSTLEEMSSEYKAYIPIAITSLTPTQLSESSSYGGRAYLLIGRDSNNYYSTDVNGKSYNSNNIIASYPSSEEATGEKHYVVYNLNYQYGILSGVVYRPYSSLSCSFAWTEPGKVKIYGDDVLIYESKPFTQDVYDCEEISIDVSGVRNLKIVLTGRWRENSYIYIGKVVFADVMLQKRIADKHIVSP